jgi:protein SCO1/2
VCGLALLSLLASTSAAGQMTGTPAPGYKREPGATSSSVPTPLREVGFDQNLDQMLPLDTSFRDESGRAVRLADYFGERPVILVFAYYTCPMLCAQVITGVGRTLDVLSLAPGRDFELVTVSFDPRDTPATAVDKKALYLERYKREGAAAGAHFLTGDPESIARLTKAAGFRYVWDDATGQFAHPTGVVVATRDGRIARYIFGIEYGPRDLRLAVVEASTGAIGSPVDALLLYCYHYDPATGRYGLVIMRALRVAGALTVMLIGTFIIVMVRRERHRKPEPGAQRLEPGA